MEACLNARRLNFPLVIISVVVSGNLLTAQIADHKGFKDIGGALIGESDQTQFAIHHYSKGTLHVLILEDLSSGPNSPKELASLRIRINDERQFLSFGQLACKVNGKLDPFLIGLTRSTGTEYCPALKAWKVDPHKRTFTPYPSKQVECEDPGFGI